MKMMMNMICKQCKKKVHYCSSCGFVDYCYDEGYCSNKCWEASEEYKTAMEEFDIFNYEFDEKQVKFLLYLLDGEYSNYEMKFFDRLKNHPNFNV